MLILALLLEDKNSRARHMKEAALEQHPPED